MSVISNQRGVSIIAVVATMLILSVMGVTLISMVTTGSDISINQMQSARALNVAKGGIEYALQNYISPNYAMQGATEDLGAGTFTVATPAYLTAAVAIGGTTINVNDTSSFAATGRIVIDSEVMAYTAKAANTFTIAAAAADHASGNAVYPVTTVSDNPLLVASTTINVASTAGFVIPGVIKIDSEYIYCRTAPTSTSFDCTGGRGYSGSTAADHGIGSNAFQYILVSTGTAGNAQRVVRVAVDGGSSSVIALDTARNKKTSDSSMNWNHNVSGTNRLLIVGVSIKNDASQTVSSVFYNTSALSLVPGSAVNNGTSAHVEIWYMTNPSSGNNNVEVNLTGSASMVAGSVSLADVDQTSPIDVVATPATGTGTAPTVTVTTTADGAWVIDTMGAGNASAAASPGQTEQWDAATGGATKVRGAGSTEGSNSPPGNVTMSWTLGDPVDWAITAVSIKPAPGNVVLLDFREVY